MLRFYWTSPDRTMIEAGDGLGIFFPPDEQNRDFRKIASLLPWITLRGEALPDGYAEAVAALEDGDEEAIRGHAEEQTEDTALVYETDEEPEAEDEEQIDWLTPEEETSAAPEADEVGQADEVRPDDETSSEGEALVEIVDEDLTASGAGVMIENRAGIMAADRTEELRAMRLGETVMAHSARIDARYPDEKALELQQLRSRSNAAADGTGEPLTDEEQDTLDALALNEIWLGRMAREQRARLDMLRTADADVLHDYQARQGWPE